VFIENIDTKQRLDKIRYEQVTKNMRIRPQSFPNVFVDQQKQSNRNCMWVEDPSIDICTRREPDVLDYR
jgi:hypothetical protein